MAGATQLPLKLWVAAVQRNMHAGEVEKVTVTRDRGVGERHGEGSGELASRSAVDSFHACARLGESCAMKKKDDNQPQG